MINQILIEAIRIAKLAGVSIRELRKKKDYEEYLKNSHELVTTADLLADAIIKSEISRQFPAHNVISEESQRTDNWSLKKPTWIIDPIDGTVGYANNHYQVAVSIAFAINDSVEVGVVHNPFLGETFYATRGSGAFLNGQQIFAKKCTALNDSVIGTGFPHSKENINGIVEVLKSILPKVKDIRRLGSPALDICWVACGRLQGFYEERLAPWDVAAARLIALEADATVGHYFSGQDRVLPNCIEGNCIIVSSPGIFNALKNILADSVNPAKK